MVWIDIKDFLPVDDEPVVVYNQLEGCVPILASYAEEQGQFYPINSLNSFPVVVTHWRDLIPYPE